MNIRPDRKFLASLVSLALPIAAQSFLLSSVNLIDNFMIGRLGESSIAAVALGNQVYFLVMMLLFGVTSGAGIFVSQFWGKRDLATIHRIQGLTLLVSFSACLIVSVTAVAVPEGLIGLLTTDTAVIREGARYLRIVAFSYPLTAITFSFVMVLRSCGFTRIPFNAAAAALSTNVVLNAVLIFGMFGFPALGVRGAALGTLIARALETCIIIVLSYRRERPSAATPERAYRLEHAPYQADPENLPAGSVQRNRLVHRHGGSELRLRPHRYRGHCCAEHRRYCFQNAYGALCRDGKRGAYYDRQRHRLRE